MGRKKSKPRDPAQASSHPFEGKLPASENETEGMAAQHLLPVFRKLFQSQMERPEYWWIMDDCIQAVGTALTKRNYVVVDGFMGEKACKELRDEVRSAQARGAMCAGSLAGGRSGGSATYTMQSVRGDHAGWFTGKEAHLHWRRLPELLTKIDTLVSELKNSEHGKGLRTVDARSNAMCTCFPGSGTHYIRHCDNPNANGRVLTCIYYLNAEWAPGDGGELRIYSCLRGEDTQGFTDCDGISLRRWDANVNAQPAAPVSIVPGIVQVGNVEAPNRVSSINNNHNNDNIDGILGNDGILDDGEDPIDTNNKSVKVEDVQPLGDRLLLFFCDKRVPHEVLPTNVHRFAVTTWFMSSEQVALARSNPSSQADELAVQEEVANMKQKYGGEASINPKRVIPSSVDVRVGDIGGSAAADDVQLPLAAATCNPDSDAGHRRASLDLQVPLTDEEVQRLQALETERACDKLSLDPTSSITPDYAISTSEVNDQGLPLQLELRISLPGISGTQDVELDLEPWRVYLKTVGINYSLGVHLPHTVFVDNARAKWNRRDCVLVIRLHVAEFQE